MKIYPFFASDPFVMHKILNQVDSKKIDGFMYPSLFCGHFAICLIKLYTTGKSPYKGTLCISARIKIKTLTLKIKNLLSHTVCDVKPC